jgi:hypothetical protein
MVINYDRYNTDIRTAHGSSFKLVGVSKRLQTAVQTATTEAKRLDDKEAPQREAARMANETDYSRPNSINPGRRTSQSFVHSASAAEPERL